MAWIQVGKLKINATSICYIEELGNGVRIWFQNTTKPLELHFDEAKAFWKHLKAEDAMIGKATHTVFTKTTSSKDALDVKSDTHHPAAKPAAAPAAAHSSHSSHSTHGTRHAKH